MRGTVSLVLAKAHSWDRLLRRPGVPHATTSRATVHAADDADDDARVERQTRHGLRRGPRRPEALIRSSARRCASWG